MGLNWVPLGESDFHVAGRFPGASSVSVRVIDVTNDATVSPTPAAMLQSAQDADFWTYNLAAINGASLGGTPITEILSATLLVVMTPTGGTGVEEHLIVQVNGQALQDSLTAAYGGYVYVAGTSGLTGTELPKGTPGLPLGNMTDAKALQVKLAGLGVVVEAIRVLESSSVFNIEATYSGGAFVLEGAGAASGLLGGQAPQVRVLSGADVNGSAFRGLAFTGGSSDFGDITGDGVALSNCSVGGDLGWEGVLTLFDCTISQPIELVQGAAKFIQALLAARCSLFDVTINNDDNDATAVLFECTGTVRLENHSTAGAGLSSFGGQGLIVDLQPTVSDGVFNFTGLNSIIDQKTGGVVNKAAFIDEASLGQHVLIDQREYVTDGTQKLMVKARRSTFLSEADLLAVTPDTTGPFTEGKHPAAIKTQYVETTPGAAANEPEAFKVRTI